MPDITNDITNAAKDITNVAKDATYVAIGLGVLGVQKAQVQRQELKKFLAQPTSGISEHITSVRGDVSDAVVTVDAKVEGLIAQVEAVFVPFEDRLPSQARDLAKQVHAQVTEARGQIRSLILSTVEA